MSSEEEKAATKIQAIYRGNAARKLNGVNGTVDSSKVPEENDKEEPPAANNVHPIGMTEEEMHKKMAQKEVSVSAVRAARQQEETYYWTQDTRFTLLIGIVILFNAAVLGVEADYGKVYPEAFGVIEHLLTAIFSLELIAHLVVERPRVYFSDTMNWLDCFLVLMSVADVWIIRNVGMKVDLRMMSVLRMLRLVRLARLLRLVRMFKELTLLVTGFIDSIRTLTWALMFLLSVVYVFAIFARQMIGDASDCTDEEVDAFDCDAQMKPLYKFNREIGDQTTLFGGVDLAMLTLFVCLTEGCGIDIVHPTTLISPALILFWGIFIFFTTYGLLNLIVGVFL